MQFETLAITIETLTLSTTLQSTEIKENILSPHRQINASEEHSSHDAPLASFKPI